jgi:hypothetical protein
MTNKINQEGRHSMSASPDTGAPVWSPTGHQTGQDTRAGKTHT